MEEGISLFSTLLNNKHFLIVFVHALEQQKDFAVRDRYELQQNEEPCWQSAHLRGVPCAPQETLVGLLPHSLCCEGWLCGSCQVP